MELTREHEKKIKKILRKGKTSTRPRAIRLFGAITGDSNPIHQKSIYAKENGLPDVPVIGGHISAISLERALEIQGMLGYGRPTAWYHNTKFKEPVFPGSKKLGPLEIEEINGETVVKMYLHQRNIVRAISETRLGNISKKIERPENPDAGPIYAEVIPTLRGERAYQRLVRAQSRDSLSPGWLQALFPGTLMRVLDSAYQGEREHAPTPLNLRMATHVEHPAKREPLRLEVYMKSKGQRGATHFYDFYGEIKQGNERIGVAELMAGSRTPIDGAKIRAVQTIPTITL